MSSPWEDGDPASKLLVLAEAPGRQEMRQKSPLVGPSGDVFKDCLHTAGLTRRECYILNVFPFEVQKDKQGNISDGRTLLWHSKKGMTEDGEEAARDTFDRITNSGANAILTMGSPALDYIMGKHLPILKWRGSPLWSERFGKKLIPTLHPAATIHGVYNWRYLIINDMGKISQELDDPELHLPKRALIISPTFEQVMKYMDECWEAKRFATDIEVMNRNVYCLSLSHHPSHAITIPFVSETGQPFWKEEGEIEIWHRYGELMSDPNVMKVNQNIVGFDSVFLLDHNHIHTNGPLGDTMIAHNIMYPHLRMGLDLIASFHTREPYWKDEGKVWNKPVFDWDVFQGYCGKDAAVALESWIVLEKEMEDGGYRSTYDRTVRMAKPLAYMSVNGLKVDREGLEHTKVRLAKAIIEKEAELLAITKVPVNVQSPKQCAEYFYDMLGIKPYYNREGGVTTDDKAMSRIFRRGEKGSKEAKLVQGLRALLKLKGTYVDVVLDEDGRLRCSWNPRGTWTGRLSSSQTILDTGLNLQNLHPEFKGFIVAG